MRRDALRFFAVLAPPAIAVLLGACSWDFGKVFDRADPRVEQARHDLEASVTNPDADLAPTRASLEEFLDFRCVADGGQDLVIDRPFASVDLGLVTFRLAELVGQRFGDEELDAGDRAEAIAGRRAQELECAHLLLLRIVKEPKTPPALALRARYLLGNFAFLARRYQDAIDDYDQALLQHPARGVIAADAGPADDEDALARDAAWNRAIALQRLEDEKKRDAGPDGDDAQDAPPDAADAPDGADGSDGGDAGEGGPPDASEAGAGDSGGGETGGRDAGSDGGSDAAPPPPPKPSPSTSARPMSSTAVDLRELNRFDEKSPLDLELPFKKRPRLPRSLDK